MKTGIQIASQKIVQQSAMMPMGMLLAHMNEPVFCWDG